MLINLLKKILRCFIGDYAAYRIYTCNLSEIKAPEVTSPNYRRVSQDQLLTATSPLIRDEAWYGGDGAIGFAYLESGDIKSIMWVWYGERYKKRNFWPLKEKEAKVVHTLTIPEYRGRGIATTLKLFAAQEMRNLGFQRLYTRVWYNHKSSIRTSEKAGWSELAWVFVVHPFGRKKPWRFDLKKKSSDRPMLWQNS